MTDLQIQYFLKVAQHLSYTAAARELFVSQPSLSKQVAALERNGSWAWPCSTAAGETASL